MNKKYTWIAIVVIIVILIAVFSHKSSAPTSTGPIQIGAALALTGDAATWGEAERNGINLALKEINANGGINGRNLELATEDTKSSSKDSVSAVQKLINFDNVT